MFYSIQAKNRDNLVKFLNINSIDAKKHYPIPMHLQTPLKKTYKYKLGDFPNAERLSKETLSLPVHEFLNLRQLKFMCNKIKEFYSK